MRNLNDRLRNAVKLALKSLTEERGKRWYGKGTEVETLVACKQDKNQKLLAGVHCRGYFLLSRLSPCLAGCLAGRLYVCLRVCLSEFLTDSLAGWLAGWLTGCTDR